MYYNGTCALYYGPACPDYQGVLIFQVILYNVSFITSTKCIDYAGVLSFKCQRYKILLYTYINTNALQCCKIYGGLTIRNIGNTLHIVLTIRNCSDV